ncbi:MAG: hypothetical protein SGI97_07700 [candidate division Zixibacteria bacterium]|nr:hypothetical protein [candidate division Zixibacteria bacterium]
MPEPKLLPVDDDTLGILHDAEIISIRLPDKSKRVTLDMIADNKKVYRMQFLEVDSILGTNFIHQNVILDVQVFDSSTVDMHTLKYLLMDEELRHPTAESKLAMLYKSCVEHPRTMVVIPSSFGF